MKITGTTKVCGVIGNPIAHTLSPVIHNNVAEYEGNNMSYLPFKVEESGLKDAIYGAYELGIVGLNVTVPHKKNVMNYLSDVDEAAKDIGAVNTLVRCEGGYKGYNTDILGLDRALSEDGIIIKDNIVVILGAGGVSNAITYLCAKKGAKKIYLLNRTFKKAEDLARHVNSCVDKDIVIPMAITDYADIKEDNLIAIQATKVGMHPDVEHAAIEDINFYKKITAAYDTVYTPFETKFMRCAKEAGASAYNGLKMLLYQGIIAYEMWFNTTVSKEDSIKAYELMKKELGIDE